MRKGNWITPLAPEGLDVAGIDLRNQRSANGFPWPSTIR